MFYYVCCPVCDKDLSQFVDEDNPKEDTIYCIHCETALLLKQATQWDDDYGMDITLFWFEKES
ncbi:MAG: hypothetical protein NUK65_07850 [Firmicutes bacterium]|nr:hypothetical protein [Bacillota bacterium]